MARRSSSSGCSVCLRCILKLLNFFLAFVGFAILLYASWALYKLDIKPSSIHSQKPQEVFLPHFALDLVGIQAAWFLYFLLSLGTGICLITLCGHVGAETSNDCCLSCYTFFVVLLIMFQGAFVADIILNENWQENIPADSTGLFDTIKSFVEENLDVCKWAGLAIVLIEGLIVLVAMFVKAVTPSSQDLYYDSDDEYDRRLVRQPLLVPGQRGEIGIPTTGILVEGWPSRADNWSTRTRDKYGLVPGKQGV